MKAAAVMNLQRLDIVGGKHARFASALHGATHPSLINHHTIKDDITLVEAHLILVRGLVVIHSLVLGATTRVLRGRFVVIGLWLCFGLRLGLGLVGGRGDHPARGLVVLLFLCSSSRSSVRICAMSCRGGRIALVVLGAADGILGCLYAINGGIGGCGGVLTLGLLVLLVVLDHTLALSLLLEAHRLGSVNNSGGVESGIVSLAIWQLLKALVGAHGKLDLASLAREALLVPDLVQAVQLVDLVHGLVAPCAGGHWWGLERHGLTNPYRE